MPPCEGGYKNFRIGDLFEIHPTKAYKLTNRDLFTPEGNTPVLTNTSSNNGIGGYSNLSTTEKGNIITFSDTTTSDAIFYQELPFIGYPHVQGLYPKYYKDRWNKRTLLYIVALFRSNARDRFDYATKFTRVIAQQMEILLPTTSRGDIDFAFMESRIRELEEERMRELEEERMRELEAYLAAAGFANCDLTPEEQGALRKFNDQQVNFKQYTIGDLFEKLANNTKHKFNKRNDVSSEKSATFNIPLVNAKHGDNGIMFYGKDSVFLSTAMTIDIVQNGAVATGDVYAQPQPTGVLWDAYLIKNKVYNDTESTLLYFATSISKSIKPKYCYDKKATWERVQKDLISLPTTPDGKIDYAFMETYISAIKKQTITALKDFITREHTAYEQVINA